jgi:hypothetical protein
VVLSPARQRKDSIWTEASANLVPLEQSLIRVETAVLKSPAKQLKYFSLMEPSVNHAPKDSISMEPFALIISHPHMDCPYLVHARLIVAIWRTLRTMIPQTRMNRCLMFGAPAASGNSPDN